MKPLISFILFSLLSLTLLNSCKECCEGNDYKFRIRLELLTTENITVSIEYSTKNSNLQTSKKIINSRFDDNFIEFCLPEEPLDLQIRFLGVSKNQNLEVLSVLLENKDNQMFIQQNNRFHQYFIENKSIKYIKDSDSYNFLETKEGIEPVFSAREILKSRLQKRLKL